MINLPNLPWNLIGYILGVIALFLAGYFYKGNKVEKDKLKAERELHKRISKARGRILVIERDGRKKIEEIKDHAKKDDSHAFSAFANSVFRKIFGKSKD